MDSSNIYDIYSLFPVVALDLYTNEERIITLNVAPKQYLRSSGYYNDLQKDCFKVGIAKSDTGSVIGEYMY